MKITETSHLSRFLSPDFSGQVPALARRVLLRDDLNLSSCGQRYRNWFDRKFWVVCFQHDATACWNVETHIPYDPNSFSRFWHHTGIGIDLRIVFLRIQGEVIRGWIVLCILW